MTDPDPILAAKSVAEMMAAIDTVYHLDLPTTAPAGTTLAVLWAAAITVAKDPEPHVLYRGTGTTAIPLRPLPATVFVLVNDPAGPLPGTAVPDHRGGAHV